MNTHSFPVVRGVASLVLAVTILSLVPGCQSSGQAELTIRGGLFGFDINFRGDVEWGPPQPGLPAGSRSGGVVTINGREAEVYRAPDGTYWVCFVDAAEYNPIVGDPFGWSDLFVEAPIDWSNQLTTGGRERVTESSGHPSSVPWMTPPDRVLEGWYFVDLDADFAHVEFTLPADGAHNFRDPDTMPYALAGWGVEEGTDGSLLVWYEGIVNDVLGAAMLQGMRHLSREEPGIGFVEIELSLEYTAAFVDINGKHDTNGYAMIPIYESR